MGTLRPSDALRRDWSVAKVTLAYTVLIAIPVACAVMLYYAVTDGSIITIRRHDNSWITYETSPRWYVASVVVYALATLLAVLALIAIFYGWRKDQAFIRRGRTAPRIDDAIRIDADER